MKRSVDSSQININETIGLNEGLLERIYGNVSKKVKKVRKNVVRATAPLAVITSIGAGAAVLPNTGCVNEEADEQNVQESEKVATVKQAVSYTFGTPVKLPDEISDPGSSQISPSVVDNGASWVLYYESNHDSNSTGTMADPYRATINKSNLAVINGPTQVSGANNDGNDLAWILCDNYAWDINDNDNYDISRYNTGGSSTPSSVSDKTLMNTGLYFGSLGCYNNKLIGTAWENYYQRPFINNGTWTPLTNCNDGDADMRGINIYNGNLIYGLDTPQGTDIKIRPWNGSDCTGSSENIDGNSKVINVDGKSQLTPFMLPDGSGLVYAQWDSGFANLYFAPIISAPVCGNGTEEGTEQCDNGVANTNTPCSAPYGGSCTYCDTSCNEHTVQGAFCDDDIINGPEQCDDGPVLNGQACTPAYNQTCTYCSDTCATVNVPKQQWCGDGVKNGPEACDGSQLGGATCVTLGFPGGTLGCDASCSYNTTNCDALPSCGDGSCNGSENCQNCAQDCGDCCGNGTINAGEQCDGANLNGGSCETQGFDDGTLGCDSNCDYDTTDCSNGGAGGAAGAGGSAGEGGTGGIGGSAGEGGSGGVDGGTGGTGGTETGGTGGTETGGTGGTGGTETGGTGGTETGGTGGAETGGTGGTGPDCNMKITQGSCQVSCTDSGAVTISFPADASCKAEHVSKSDCSIEATRPAVQSENTITVSTGGDINVPMGYDNLIVNNDGHCFNKSQTAGISGGFMGTAMQRVYPSEFNEAGKLSHVAKYSILRGQMNWMTGDQPLNINTSDQICANNQPCKENETPSGASFLIDELNPINPGFPDGGTVISPPKEGGDDGGCSVCAATPGDVSSNINGYVGLVLLGGVMAYRRSRRREE